MNYLINGGGFNNKGAEAMTLVALKNIYENDEAAKVYMFESAWSAPFEFKKPLSYIRLPQWYVLKQTGGSLKGYRLIRIKELIKAVIPGYMDRRDRISQIRKALGSIDIVIDVSGYAFGSKWTDEENRNWLNRLALLEKSGAKIYLMPQSFGPLDFGSEDIRTYAQKVLSKCERIYAREDEGKNYLKELGIESIKMPDSVLIEKEFDASCVIKDHHRYIESIEPKRDKNIAIVPNYRLIDMGGTDHKGIIRFYLDVIDRYIPQYDFYLTAHAGEDLKICREIKDHYAADDRVIYIDHVMNSFNFEALAKKMDFVIASRYHSIIHSYKEFTPAVILGWADKYLDIAENVGQTGYVIDLDRYEDAAAAVEAMERNHKNESITIMKRVQKLQEQSCYDFLRNNK